MTHFKIHSYLEFDIDIDIDIESTNILFENYTCKIN